MTTYSDIIARLENATGPDRELDVLIYVMCGLGKIKNRRERHFMLERADGQRTLHVSVNDGMGPYQPYDQEDVSGMVGWNAFTVPPYTASLDAAIALVERMLPGWGWRVATCCVSDDAYVFPDFNSPEHGQDLLDRLPVCPDGENEWSNFTDVDQRPPGRPAIALLTALFIALEELERIGQKP